MARSGQLNSIGPEFSDSIGYNAFTLVLGMGSRAAFDSFGTFLTIGN